MNLSAGFRTRKRILALALCLLCPVVLPGCLVSGELTATGAGTLTVRTRLTSPNQLDSTGQKMKSSSVQLVSAEVDADKWATYKLAFDDVAQLSTTELFENTTFALRDGKGGVKTLSVRFSNKKPVRMTDELLNYFGGEMTVRIGLPGPVVESNAASVEGQTVVWKFPLELLTSGPSIDLQATFRVEPPAAVSDTPAEK